MKTAILIDGAFLNVKIRKVPNPEVQASRVVAVANLCLDAPTEILYRIFYYDCGPYEGKKHDLSGTRVNFKATPQCAYQKSFLAHLARQPYLAVRLGMISFDGWKVTPTAMMRLRNTGLAAGPLTLADFQPDFKQKGVDMRIGLDMALLALDRLVERVVLVTADSDFIPAMKLARREGLQVVLISLSNRAKPELSHHADLYRNPNLAGI